MNNTRHHYLPLLYTVEGKNKNGYFTRYIKPHFRTIFVRQEQSGAWVTCGVGNIRYILPDTLRKARKIVRRKLQRMQARKRKMFTVPARVRQS